MQFKWAKEIVFPVVCLIFFFSCDRPAVDKEYLQSKEYNRFSKQQKKEYAAQIRSRQSLRQYLSAYQQCPQGTRRSLPLQIDSTLLKNSGKTCRGIGDEFKTVFSTEYIGYSEFRDVTIRWLVLKKKSVYENWEIIGASYRDSSLVGFQSLGTFRQNLLQDISTVIKVSQKGDFIYISSTVNRGYKYPFKYDNIVESVFRMDSLGIFSNQAGNERTYQSLSQFLEEYNHCKLGRQWSFPVHMDTSVVNGRAEACSRTESSFNTNFTVRTIGYTEFGKVVIRWIELEQDGVEEDHKLLAATFRNGALTDYAEVGEFRNHSGRNTLTVMKARNQNRQVHITSTIRKSISLPLKQLNVSIKGYEIDTQGNIRQHQ